MLIFTWKIGGFPKNERCLKSGKMLSCEGCHLIFLLININKTNYFPFHPFLNLPYFLQVRKIKAIYHCLNLFSFDVTQKALVAECWMPEHDISKIQERS
jgi:hypothetical protein